MANIKTRRFQKAGIEVSEISLGAWAIGGVRYGEVDEQNAAETIEVFLEAGGNLIDTARMYFDSEERIGNTLEHMRNRADVVIATKTAHGNTVENVSLMRDDLEESLRKLKTDYVDIYQIHHPSDDPDVIDASLQEMIQLKAEGKIRAIGASIKGPNVTQETADLCRRYIDTGVIDALQLIYSIFRQSNAQVFEHAHQAGVGIIARTALESGFLTGKYDGKAKFPKGDHRTRWSSDQLRQFKEASDRIANQFLNPPFDTLPQLAIKFSLAPAEVTTLILGARTAAQVNRNLAAAKLPDIEPELIGRLEEAFSGFEEVVNIEENG